MTEQRKQSAGFSSTGMLFDHELFEGDDLDVDNRRWQLTVPPFPACKDPSFWSLLTPELHDQLSELCEVQGFGGHQARFQDFASWDRSPAAGAESNMRDAVVLYVQLLADEELDIAVHRHRISQDLTTSIKEKNGKRTEELRSRDRHLTSEIGRILDKLGNLDGWFKERWLLDDEDFPDIVEYERSERSDVLTEFIKQVSPQITQLDFITPDLDMSLDAKAESDAVSRTAIGDEWDVEDDLIDLESVHSAHGEHGHGTFLPKAARPRKDLPKIPRRDVLGHEIPELYWIQPDDEWCQDTIVEEDLINFGPGDGPRYASKLLHVSVEAISDWAAMPASSRMKHLDEFFNDEDFDLSQASGAMNEALSRVADISANSEEHVAAAVARFLIKIVRKHYQLSQEYPKQRVYDATFGPSLDIVRQVGCCIQIEAECSRWIQRRIGDDALLGRIDEMVRKELCISTDQPTEKEKGKERTQDDWGYDNSRTAGKAGLLQSWPRQRALPGQAAGSEAAISAGSQSSTNPRIQRKLMPASGKQTMRSLGSSPIKKRSNKICGFFINGSCHKGNRCQFFHPTSVQIAEQDVRDMPRRQ